MTIAKTRYGVTLNVFTLLVVNSLTFYLRTFWGWEYHQSIGNQKLGLFSVACGAWGVWRNAKVFFTSEGILWKNKNMKKNPEKIRFWTILESQRNKFRHFPIHYTCLFYFRNHTKTWNQIKWLFSSSLVEILSKIHLFLLFFTIYRSFQLNHQNCWKFKNRFKTLLCYVWTHVNTFPVLVVPNFGFILSCYRKSALRSKSPPTFQVTPFHGIKSNQK